MPKLHVCLIFLTLVMSLPAHAQDPQAADISGRVWQDANANAIQDPGEPGVAGIHVLLYDPDGWKSAITDSMGTYEFSQVPLGAVWIGVYTSSGGLQDIDGFYGFPSPLYGPLSPDWVGVPPGWIPTYDPDGVDTPYDIFESLGAGGLSALDFGFQEATRIFTLTRTDPPVGDSLVKIASGPVAGSLFAAALASDDWAPALPAEGVAGKLMASDPLFACSPLVNDLSGKIAVMSRGRCPFADKIQHAADAGAVAAIVHNINSGEELVAMTGAGASVGIPAAFVGYTDGQALLAAEGEDAELLPDENSFDFKSSYGSFKIVLPLAKHESGNIEAGNAWVEEQPPSGWKVKEAKCFISDLTSGVAIESSPASISLQKGDLAICDFLNVESTSGTGDNIFRSSFEN